MTAHWGRVCGLSFFFVTCAFSQLTIDCGSASDQYFVGGTPYTISTPGALGDLTLRYGAFRYSIPRPPGLYFVSLVLRETGTVAGPKQRSFSMTINGQVTSITNYDLYSIAGLLPVQLDFQALSNGFITLDFSYTLRSAVASSISITPFSSNPKEFRFTEAVPSIQGGVYQFPDPLMGGYSGPITVQHLRVYRNGVRQREKNQFTGSGPEAMADYAVEQQYPLRIRPNPAWEATDTVIADYNLIVP